MTYRVRIGLRLPAIVYFLLTAWFGLLSYVPFAYLQFLRHLLFAWLEFFVQFHHWLFWSAFLLALLSVADDLGARRPAAWAFAAAFAVAGSWLLFHPILPNLGNDPRSLVVTLASLMGPAWLAVIDHRAARGCLQWPPEKARGDAVARALGTSAWTATYVWAAFSLIAGLRIPRDGDALLSVTERLLSIGWSLPLHLAFAAAGVVFIVTVYATTRRPRIQYVMILTGFAGAGWLVLTRVVFPSIAFQGPVASSIAVVLSAWGALVWSGLALRCTCDARSAGPTLPVQAHDPLEIALSPLAFRRPSAAAASLVALVVIAYIAVEYVEKRDWYFLLQKLIACLTWIIAGGILYRFSSAKRRGPAAALMGVSVAILLGTWLIANPGRPSAWALAIDRYAPYDASLTLLDQLAKPPSRELADITTFLIAHSNLEGGRARPASVDFVAPLNRSGAQRPHIFIFVIDSLRRDYLSPYNDEVTFTPAIQSFAAESIVFTRAFTRYGGTGLSEPAIWSGALLPHRQYVTPFAPMNALEKLIDAEGYHRLISVDSILRELLSPSAATRELDAGVQNRLYDACRTLDEIRAVMPDTIRDGHPVFVFTQPQNLHLANVAIDQTPRTGPAFGRFYAPYAARLQRLDACLGAFINHLKQIGIYDNSIVVLTSDHGDSLGDEGRWGHAFTVFPEVLRVPLIVHAPGPGRATDPGTLAFTTDITPTLYAMLGHSPVVRDPLFGMTLIGADASILALRRRRPYLVASSYGPVYGVVAENGERLYVIDGVNTAEYQYDLTRGSNGERTVVTDTDRTNALKALRAQVEEIARFYGIRSPL